MITYDFENLRRMFSLPEIVGRDTKLEKEGRRWMGCCPFHSEDTPSFNVFRTEGGQERFKCFGCGLGGDVVEYIKTMRGCSAGEAVLYLSGGDPRFIKEDERTTLLVERTEEHEAGGCVIDTTRIRRIHPYEIQALCSRLHTRMPHRPAWEDESISSVRNYLASRKLLIESPSLQGSDPYPIGTKSWPQADPTRRVMKTREHDKGSILEGHFLPFFPKVIQTRRNAQIFHVEDSFDKMGGLVGVGYKARLTPPAWGKYLQYNTRVRGWEEGKARKRTPRWLAQPGYTFCIPWEFDAREDADILIITEGPSDGIRLFNEIHRDDLGIFKWGRAHFTAVESTTSWSEGSLPIRILDDGSTIGFFDGYHHIILLLDPDQSGREAATRIRRLIESQLKEASTKVKRRVSIWDVTLPDGDVCEFFDQRRTVADLFSVCRDSERHVIESRR